MSYEIQLDGTTFCSSNAGYSSVLNPIVTLEVNKAGSLKFTMMPDHPRFDDIVLRSSVFTVYQNDKLIFEGTPTSEELDFFNRKTVICEGELGYLNNSIQRPAVYQSQTAESLLSAYIAAHNAQADATQQFTVGTVTVDGGNSIYRYTNYENTMTEIAEDLIDNFGGFLRVRHSGNTRYLDYLASSPRTSSQVVSIGQNLMDLSRNLDALDICTVLIPLGAKTGEQIVEGLDERLTIKSVNSGRDYLVGTAQATYGNIWRTQIWDDVTTATALKTKAQNYLSDAQWANLVVSATAIDLGLTSEDVEQFEILDMIRVLSEPHGIDRYFMLTKMTINLDHPGDTQITLGQETKLSLSARTAQNGQIIEKEITQVSVNAAETARKILESATGGNIFFIYDSNGVCTEMRILDTADPATATKWWVYNINGWGYRDENGNYTAAATMDGTIYVRKGNIGAWTIDNNSIFSGTKDSGTNAGDATLRGSGEFTRDIGGTTRQHLKFAIGSNFGVSTGGRLYATDGIFSGEIEADSGEVGGWTIDEDQLGKTGTITPHTYTSLDLAVITNVLSDSPTITEEEALAQYPQCDVDGDGHITFVDLTIVMAMLLEHIPNGTITSYTTGLNAGKPYGLGFASSNKGAGFSFGAYGAYSPTYLGKNIVLVNNSMRRTILNASGLRFMDTGGVIPNNKNLTDIGSISGENGSQISLASGSWASSCSMSLTAGKAYVINGIVSFASNTSGYRRVLISTTAASTSPINQFANVVAAAANGLATRANVTAIYRPSSNVTIYLNVYQNSGSALNVTGYLQAITIEG